jgi:hypothetical protein
VVAAAHEGAYDELVALGVNGRDQQPALFHYVGGVHGWGWVHICARGLDDEYFRNADTPLM